MNRREFLAGAMASAVGPARPNVIFILADDMGWQDLSCYGNTLVRTPNVDRLAADGIRFENFYAASAVCSPSRAAILTGRYPLRFDIRFAFVDDENHLPVVPNMPSLLKKAGYSTAHVGKWHLGGLHQKHIRDRAHSIPGPNQQGFDYYLCQSEEQPMRRQMGNQKTLYRKGGTCLIRNEQNVPESDPYYTRHWTDIIGDEAVRLVGELHAKGKPFFLNVWHLVPHAPYEPAPEPHWSGTAADGISEDQHCFRSMVSHMDATVGALLKKLDELRIRDNTLIVFSSDNGGAFEANIGPYKGGKTDLHEGGIRVPGIVSWPARIRRGQTTKMIGHHCDLLPTICAAAGAPIPKEHALDGLNLFDVLTGRGKAPERGTMTWQIDLAPRIQRHYPRPQPHATEVARRGKWKLMAKDGRPVGLFDLEADPLEDNNLLERKPEVIDQLAKEVRGFLTAERDRSGQR
jgi:arylsulfatase A